MPKPKAKKSKPDMIAMHSGAMMLRDHPGGQRLEKVFDANANYSFTSADGTPRVIRGLGAHKVSAEDGAMLARVPVNDLNPDVGPDGDAFDPRFIVMTEQAWEQRAAEQRAAIDVAEQARLEEIARDSLRAAMRSTSEERARASAVRDVSGPTR